MNFKITTALLLAMLLLVSFSGCSLANTARQLDAAEDVVEDRMDMAEDALENAVQNAVAPAPPSTTAPTATGTAAILTKEEAQAIALEHAGFTADQVTYLRTEYEIDDGRPQYEVQFHQDRWEYDYEIDAETGKILSFDKDD